MAKAKKEAPKFYKIDEANQMIYIEQKDIPLLSAEDNKTLAFYKQVLAYDIIFVEPEEKKRKTFKIELAEKYIAKNDKDNLAAFTSIKSDALKAADQYKKINAAKAAAEAEDATEEIKKAAPKAADIKKAQTKMINENRVAYQAQKDYFIETYGEEAYKAVMAASVK